MKSTPIRRCFTLLACLLLIAAQTGCGDNKTSGTKNNSTHTENLTPNKQSKPKSPKSNASKTEMESNTAGLISVSLFALVLLGAVSFLLLHLRKQDKKIEIILSNAKYENQQIQGLMNLIQTTIQTNIQNANSSIVTSFSDGMNQLLVKFETDISDLSKKLDALSKKNDNQSLSSSYPAMHRSIENIEKQIKSFEQDVQKRAELEREKKEVDTLKKDLESKIQHAKEAARIEAYHSYENDRKGWVKRLEELTQHTAQFDAQINQFKTQIAENNNQFENEKNNLNQKLAQAQKTTEDVQKELESTQKSLRALEEKKAEQQKENDQLVTQVHEKDALIASLTSSNNEKDASLTRLNNLLKESSDKIQRLESSAYPSSILAMEGFEPLKEHLDAWFRSKCEGATIIRSSLGLFAMRKHVSDDTLWTKALYAISIGITSAMRDTQRTPEETVSELLAWSRFLMKFSDDKYRFTLAVPAIGDRIDLTCMRSQSRAPIVRLVKSWVVRSANGVKDMAEVE